TSLSAATRVRGAGLAPLATVSGAITTVGSGAAPTTRLFAIGASSSPAHPPAATAPATAIVQAPTPRITPRNMVEPPASWISAGGVPFRGAGQPASTAT